MQSSIPRSIFDFNESSAAFLKPSVLRHVCLLITCRVLVCNHLLTFLESAEVYQAREPRIVE